MDWGRKWLVNFNVRKTHLVSFDRSNNTGAIDVKMNLFLNWGSYIISIAKTVSKRIGALIRSMKFLFPEVTL